MDSFEILGVVIELMVLARRTSNQRVRVASWILAQDLRRSTADVGGLTMQVKASRDILAMVSKGA